MERKKHTLVDNADEKRYEFDLGDDIAIIDLGIDEARAQALAVSTDTIKLAGATVKAP